MGYRIICDDAIAWLKKVKDLGAVVTGLPDMDEIGMKPEDYKKWFFNAIRLCMVATSKDCPAMFCQTDRKYKGTTLAKDYLMVRAARKAGMVLVWHKVALRYDPGKVDLWRPGYSHIMCFARPGFKPRKATADCIKIEGTLYPNGMGFNVAKMLVEYARNYTNKIADPFCGQGTVPYLAMKTKFEDVIGVDIDKAQCVLTEKLMAGKISTENLRTKRPAKGLLGSGK